jgi:putative IMPACT (imprinted ancient) family translation regulator
VDVLVDHALGGRLESDLRSSEVTVREVAYEDRVRIEVALPEEELTDFEVRLAELTGGRADLEVRGTTVVEVVP